MQISIGFISIKRTKNDDFLKEKEDFAGLVK